MRPSLLATDRQLAQQSLYVASAEPEAAQPALVLGMAAFRLRDMLG